MTKAKNVTIYLKPDVFRYLRKCICTMKSFVCLFDLILYVPVNKLCWDGSYKVETVLSKD